MAPRTRAKEAEALLKDLADEHTDGKSNGMIREKSQSRNEENIFLFWPNLIGKTIGKLPIVFKLIE